jgi:probable HAF family extracellular repeat protein
VILILVAACEEAAGPADSADERTTAAARNVMLGTESTTGVPVIDFGIADMLPYAIGESGPIVGNVNVPGGFMASVWRKGQIATLGAFDQPDGSRGYSWAADVNPRGAVIGNTTVPYRWGWVGFLWIRGEMQNLEFEGCTGCYVEAINARGDITGTAYGEAFLWRAGKVTTLGLPSYGYSINDGGKIVGQYRYPLGAWRAFTWDRGTLVDLGIPDGTLGSRAVDVNNAGVVVGDAYAPDGSPRCYAWKNGEAIHLGKLSPDWGCWIAGINNSGMVVGNSRLSDASYHAFAWQKGEMVDLGTLGGEWSEAVDVNNRGEIVGRANDADGRIHLVIWIPD